MSHTFLDGVTSQNKQQYKTSKYQQL